MTGATNLLTGSEGSGGEATNLNLSVHDGRAGHIGSLARAEGCVDRLVDGAGGRPCGEGRRTRGQAGPAAEDAGQFEPSAIEGTEAVGAGRAQGEGQPACGGASPASSRSDIEARISGVAQSPCESYDRVEIPEIEPDVTRVTLHGGVCPCCAKRFKAEPPQGLEPGSPFGPNLRAFVIYLRSVQGIPLARLSDVLKDLFGLDISEGALVNILGDSREPFAVQMNLIKARLLAGTALASDETGMRVGKANWWLWVFHHGDSAVFVADAHRSKAVVEAFLGEWRPDYWISDRLASQMGWAKREHQ